MVKIFPGKQSVDKRGKILHNNEFDFSKIRRSYIIENVDVDYCRGWKGHAIEKRWFLCTKGSIKLYVNTISNLNDQIAQYDYFDLHENCMDIVYVPPGNATLIKQIARNSKLMAFSDWLISTSNDEDLRWPNDIIEL